MDFAIRMGIPEIKERWEYPRPQLMRDQYTILNGWWECRFGKSEEGLAQPDRVFDLKNGVL